MLPPSLPELFSFSDIKSATDNFSTHLIIGKGSFGNVYRATIVTGPGIGNTTTVAVKRRNSDSKQGADEFWTEINLLSALRHSHLISLIGYCVDQAANEMILVYEYMANGTLADHIYKNNGTSSLLSWKQRLEICIGVGRGLEYLHTGTGINQVVIHRDLKSSNILLDADWEAKISDFGLCKTCSGTNPSSPITASVKGTYAYMDPNYRTTRQLSTKTDVYAFGVVLLEVLGGRRSLDFDVADRQMRLVLWAQQCIREEREYRIVDPALRGEIIDDGLRIYIDIALKCLQDNPKKRPTMVDVVAKLQSAWDSQFATYSSSFSSGEDEYVRITFGNAVSCSSSSANSEIDPLRRWFDTGSGKSDTIKQDPGSEPNTCTSVRRHINLKSSSINIALDVPSNGNHVNADVSMLNTITPTSETFNSLPHDKDDECEKLFRRMNPPRVAVDNESCEIATVIKVNSTSTQGLLLEVVQVLTDFDLLVTKASRTSDGLWFMDVFIVVDQEGNKVTDKAKIRNIKEALCVSTSPMGKNYKRSISQNYTTIEFIGDDRPGLLSEVSAIFSNLQCNVVSAELWTHNTRTAAVMCVSDEETKSAIIEPEKLSSIKKSLSIVLKRFNDDREASIMFSNGCTRFDRRLHEIMFADRDYKRELILNDKQRPKVDVNSYNDAYSVVSIRCKNRPNVLFATICTLKNLRYHVYHGRVDAEGPEAYMEFWIKHINGAPIKLNADRQRVIQHIEAAIQRGVYEGLKIEIRTKDRVGLLSDVTRIISEHSLTITRSEITTIGDKAGFAFYLDDSPGYPIDPKIIDHVKKEIGQKILQVKGKHEVSYHVPQESVATPTFKDVLKSLIGCVRLFICI